MRGSRPARPPASACISRAGERVERAERLVEAQHRLAGEQRAQEGDALAHAARELVGPGALEPSRPKRANSGCARRARASARDAPATRSAQRGVVERAQPRQQQVALGHQDARARARTRPGVGRLQPADELEQRGLAAAARARRRATISPGATAASGPRARSPAPQARAKARRATTSTAPSGPDWFEAPLREPRARRIAPFAGITPQVRRVSAGGGRGGVRGRYLSPLPASPP